MEKHISGAGGEGEDQNEVEEASYFCILNLPTDLIHNIFSRLQVKFISRCKVVCRAWYNLLSVPHFVRYYAKSTPFTTLVLSQHQQTHITTKFYAFSFVEISENGDCTQTTIQAKIPGWLKRNSSLSMKGSCNGLLCLLLQNLSSDCEVIYIYNPISVKSIVLPEHRFEKDEEVIVAYEFGFSPFTNNFKVLKIVPARTSNGEKVKQCEIFTVGVDDRWRQLTYPMNAEFPVCMIVLNGSVCWFARNIDSTNIAAFDFGEEKFGHISHPPGLVLNYRNMELAVLNNCLCLLDYSIPSHHTIWTMEEYGVAESWTKIVVLSSCFPFAVLYPLS